LKYGRNGTVARTATSCERDHAAMDATASRDAASPRISVVVCVKEDPRVGRLLEALARQTLDAAAFQVIVVSAGRERYDDACSASPLQVTYAHSPVARHPTQRNIGLRLVSTELFVSTDADCVPTERWLDDYVTAFDARPSECVGVGGRIRKLAESTLTQRHGITIDDGQRSLNYLPAMPLPYITGANAAYRTAAVRAVGGYDERFACGDDVDISYRLQIRGGSLSVIDTAAIEHEDRATLWAHFHRFRFYAVDQALLFKLYRGGVNKRACLCSYPWRRVSHSARTAKQAIRRPKTERRELLAEALVTLVEAAGTVVGNAQGAIRHRVVYF